jgi:hypothetical protein
MNAESAGPPPDLSLCEGTQPLASFLRLEKNRRYLRCFKAIRVLVALESHFAPEIIELLTPNFPSQNFADLVELLCQQRGFDSLEDAYTSCRDADDDRWARDIAIPAALKAGKTAYDAGLPFETFPA